MQDLHYAILGGGRLARHMSRYLDLLGLSSSTWSRNAHPDLNSHRHPDATERLRRTVTPASHVLLLVSDDAIANVLRQYPWLHGHRLVHCAGALSLPGVAGAHPLMTFAETSYTLAQYRRIPFLVESEHEFATVLPGLPNPHHTVSVEQKALYHALCVAAGNFPQLLWQQVGQRFEDRLGVSAAVLKPYLEQVLVNFLADPDHALTGPLARGDTGTITRNLTALKGDPLGDVYRAFLELHDGGAVETAALREEAS
jgi:predicted short-subunit dehydrogenase-like oxidoreductase (DUF2520 family)